MNKGYPFDSKHSYPVNWANAGDRLETDFEEKETQGVEGWSEADSRAYWKQLEEASDIIW